MFSLVYTLYQTVTYCGELKIEFGELKMESERKKEVLCECEGRRRVVSLVRNEDVKKEKRGAPYCCQQSLFRSSV